MSAADEDGNKAEGGHSGVAGGEGHFVDDEVDYHSAGGHSVYVRSR